MTQVSSQNEGPLAMANEPIRDHSDPPSEEIQIPTIRSDALFNGKRQVFIAHGDEIYRLLCTKNGKLILQK